MFTLPPVHNTDYSFEKQSTNGVETMRNRFPLSHYAPLFWLTIKRIVMIDYDNIYVGTWKQWDLVT